MKIETEIQIIQETLQSIKRIMLSVSRIMDQKLYDSVFRELQYNEAVITHLRSKDNDIKEKNNENCSSAKGMG